MKTYKYLPLFITILLIYNCSSDSGSQDNTPNITCNIPTSLEAVNITSNSAEVNWAETDNAATYVIVFGENGFIPNIENGSETTSNSFSILNLQPNTSYDVYIQSTCSDEKTSDLSQVLTFTTVCDELTYQGDLVLSTQHEVTEFGASCYQHIQGSLTIGTSNSNITSLTALNKLKTISSYLKIEENNSLTSLVGLENLEHVEFGIIISNNEILESFNGIQPLLQAMDVFYEVYISNNNSLVELNLGNLTSCIGLYIYDNNSLTSLNSLNNLTSLADLIAIRNNSSLNDFCDLQNLFTNGSFDENNVDIGNNLFNPTVEDIVNGNCSQ